MSKYYQRIVAFITCLVLGICVMTSCGSSAHDKEGHEHNHEGEGEMPKEAFLTKENLRASGIRIGKLEYKELSATIRANGSLRVPNSEKGFASSLYGGLVQRIYVHEGEYVRRGEAIAVIVNPEFVQIQEEYLSTKSRLIYAEQELRRQETLMKSEAGTGKQLQSAQAELAVLRSRRASLQKQLQLMGISPTALSPDNIQQSLTVLSPISGVVGELTAQVGQHIDPTTPLCAIINNAALHLDLNVYEQDLVKLKVGQQIHFRLTNNPSREYDAKIHTIGGTFEPNSRSIAVHCTLLGDTSGFIDGMSITGLISVGNVHTPALPTEAIVSYEGKDYVFLELSDDPSHTHEYDHSPSDSARTNARAEETIRANSHNTKESDHVHTSEGYRFRRVPVIRGASAMGYTALTFLEEIPENADFVLSGAFFVNAMLNPSTGHSH